MVALAQPALDIGWIRVSLGMEQSLVREAFRDYRMICVGGPTDLSECRSLVIQHPGSYEALSNVRFGEDMLVQSVRKYWDRGFEGTRPDRFVEQLFAVLSGGASQSSDAVRIRTEERRDPGITQRTILLEYPQRTIIISFREGLVDPDGRPVPPFVNLSEEVRCC